MNVLRLSITVWAGPLAVLIAQVINLTVGPQPWGGEALLIAYWGWTAMFLAGPVVGTVAALDGARLFGRSSDSVWNLPRVRTAAVLRVWSFSTLATVLPTAVIFVWMYTSLTWIHREVFGSLAAVMVGGVLSAAAVIGVGLALGALWGRVYGTLAAFALTLILQLASYLGSVPVLMVGGASDSLYGLKVTTPVAVLQLIGVVLLIAGAAAALFLSPRQRVGRRLSLGVAGLVLSLVPALLWPRFDVVEFQAVDDFTDGQSCIRLGADTRPSGDSEVCVSGEHRHLSDSVVQNWSRIETSAELAGVQELPARLEERPPAAGPEWNLDRTPGSVATLTMTREQLDNTSEGLNVHWLVSEVATPTWCPGLWADVPPTEEYFELVAKAQESLSTVVSFPDSDQGRSAAIAFDRSWSRLKSCTGAS